MELKEYQSRIPLAQVEQYYCIFPGRINHYKTLFGGQLLSWMDEIAFIVATKLTRKKMLTVGIEAFQFKKPILEGSFIKIVGKIEEIRTTSLKVVVTAFREEMLSDESEEAARAEFIFTVCKSEC